MKKKLTYNTLALGNLKQRRKQYFIMIVGIILALVFSTGMMLYFFSYYEAMQDEYERNFGRQDIIASVVGYDESVFDDAKSKGFISDYGTAHLLGKAYTDSENRNAEIAWLDDKAMEYANISFIEGNYPQNENEIAVTKTMLVKFGFDAKIGDKITLNVKIHNGDDFYKTVQKEYTLVGIAYDHVLYADGNWPYQYMDFIPSAFVAQNTQVDLGGKEKITAYCNYSSDKSISKDKARRIFYDSISHYNCTDPEDYNEIQTFSTYYNLNPSVINVMFTENNLYLFILIFALIAASSVTIINSFNSNLKDRKRQIGLLRAVGTTKKQIYRIFIREALIISAVCTPISIALSYLLVWLVFKLTDIDLVMSSNLAVLPISAVIGFCVVILSALIPIANASRITPMQAIRNIDNTRKMKTKKIKTQRSFDVPSILAKRSLAFSKVSKISVSIILILTISFSCLGFSYVSYEKAHPYDINYDYLVYTHGLPNAFNSNIYYSGIDENDYQDMISSPYITYAYGEKIMSVQVQIDEFSDYFKSITGINNDNMAFNWDPNEQDMTYDNYYSLTMSEFNDEHKNIKKLINEEKETVTLRMNSYDVRMLDELNKLKIDGEINPDRISSGEEIILIAPEKAAHYVYMKGDYAKNGSSEESCYEGALPDKKYHKVCEGEIPFKVGDELNITVITSLVNKEPVEMTSDDITLDHKKVRIGAIISPDELEDSLISSGIGLELVTSNQGLSTFKPGVKYDTARLFCDDNLQIDDSIDKIIEDELAPYVTKYDCYYNSAYDFSKLQESRNTALFYSLLALIIICFAISASIINNTISARIRENKKEIGTIRAFGASESILVKSYVKQMFSMISSGVIGGFALYTVGFIVASVYCKIKETQINLIFNPYLTLVLCAVLFVICSINLWIQVRKEMKNSIIENIREL